MSTELVHAPYAVTQGTVFWSDDRRDFLHWRLACNTVVEITDIQVMSDRRRGRGRALVNQLLDHRLPGGVKTVYAITRASNLIAQQFYLELRFRPVLLPDFYKDEPLASGRKYVDAVMFVRDVGSQA